jgi:hypothetical protein
LAEGCRHILRQPEQQTVGASGEIMYATCLVIYLKNYVLALVPIPGDKLLNKSKQAIKWERVRHIENMTEGPV